MKIYQIKNSNEDKTIVIRCKEGFSSDAALHRYVIEKGMLGKGITAAQLKTKELTLEEYIQFMIDKIIIMFDKKLDDMKEYFLTSPFDDMSVDEIGVECHRFVIVQNIRYVLSETDPAHFRHEALEQWLAHPNQIVDKLSNMAFDMDYSDEIAAFLDLINQGDGTLSQNTSDAGRDKDI